MVWVRDGVIFYKESCRGELKREDTGRERERGEGGGEELRR
jgi:hypothetical protein